MTIRFDAIGGDATEWHVGIRDPGEYRLDPNIYPGLVAPIMVSGGRRGATHVVLAQWGLTPFWAKDPTFGKMGAFNARAETITERPTFRTSFKSKRCIVPALAFYERKEGRWLRFKRTDGKPMAMAGLFEEETHLNELFTFTIITTLPNLLVGQTHSRMPVVLSLRDATSWLDRMARVEDLLRLLIPCPVEWLVAEDAGPVVRRSSGGWP